MMEKGYTGLRSELQIDLIDPGVKIEGDLRNGLTRAAVLVPLIKSNFSWEVLYTRRSNQVLHHKGQVSFPGGTAEPNDEGPVATALREANEEINLERASVNILGFLPNVVSITSYLITPVVGVLKTKEGLRIRTNEVERIFTIPVSFLSEQSNSYGEKRKLPSGENIDVLFFREFQGEQVWGITAAITRELIKRIK